MIDFIKPPTDNLYKFQALSGLLVILISVIYPLWLFHRATLGYLAAENEEAQLTIQRRFALTRQETLGRRKAAMVVEQDDLKKRLNELETKNPSALSDRRETTIGAEVDRLGANCKNQSVVAKR